MRSEESIFIDGEPEEVFTTVARVEDYGSFCPRYRGTRVIKQSDQWLVLERRARVAGLPVRWVSEATIEAPGRVNIRQMEGPLKGMRTEWKVERQGEGTKVTITHDLRLGFPFRPLETLIYRLIIRNMAQSVLIGIKSHFEKAGKGDSRTVLQG